MGRFFSSTKQMAKRAPSMWTPQLVGFPFRKSPASLRQVGGQCEIVVDFKPKELGPFHEARAFWFRRSRGAVGGSDLEVFAGCWL